MCVLYGLLFFLGNRTSLYTYHTIWYSIYYYSIVVYSIYNLLLAFFSFQDRKVDFVTYGKQISLHTIMFRAAIT